MGHRTAASANDISDGELRQTPPEDVAGVLHERGLGDQKLLLCTHSDIDMAGHYHPQWLAVSNDELLVIEDGDPARVARSLPLRQPQEYRAWSGVGSGLLQARIDGTYVDLIRYSNRRAYWFEKVARKLDRALAGEPIEIHPDDHDDPRRCPRCGLTLECAGDSCPQCIRRGTVLWRMIKLIAPYRAAATGMTGLLVAGITLDLVSPQLTRLLVDHVIPGVAAAGSAAGAVAGAAALRTLLIVVMVLAGVQILRQVVNMVNGRLGARIGTAITFDMRGRLAAHLQKLSLAYYDRQQVGALVGRVAYDTESLHGFVNQLTGGFLLQILMLIGVGVMMFLLDPWLALFTLIPAPLVIAGTIVFWRRIYPRHYRVWDASSKQAGMLAGLLSGIRVVKAFNQEEREAERFEAASRNMRQARFGVDTAFAAFNPVMGIVFQFGGWIVWYAGGRDVIEGRLTLGELMAFFGYLWMFYGPLATLPQLTSWLTNFVTQAHRVFEILDTPIQIAEPEEPVPLPHIRGHVRFERVSFGYNRHLPVLRDVDLEIKPGEMLGVVGPSGSGKTTLVNLICRFYDVNEGSVLIDGVDVRRVPKDELRRQLGVVLQDPFLFRGSVWDNLAYGRPDADPEAVIAASVAGNCHDFVLRRPHGYDTWVGERGAGLSGGERQRVSIARVLLTDPRILILDEATSSVDAESEAAIQRALREVIAGRTTIAIAHRLSTLRHADRIVVLDRSRVIESGTPAELLAANGPFARMVRLQQGWPLQELESLPGAVSGEGDAAAAALHPNWLTPAATSLDLGPHETLVLAVEGGPRYVGVFAVRCRPIHDPARYISLRHIAPDGKAVEIGIIREMDEWPAAARDLVERSLRKRYFVHTVQEIKDIRLQDNYLRFSVQTDLGPQRFTVRWQADRAQDYGTHGKMLLDTDENRYLVADVEGLPEDQRRLFRRYIYW